MIARNNLHWITEVGMFFEKKGLVWETLRVLESRLQQAGIDYVVIGGLALNAYNYPRQTVDVDVILTASSLTRFRQQFAGQAYNQDPRLPRRFADAQTGVAVDVLIAGQIAGNARKNKTVHFPDPAQMEVHAGLRTVSLARLIELKLVTWRYKDWGDVVELIRRNQLPESFADWFSAEVMSTMKDIDPLAMRTDLCEKKELNLGSSYPSNELRINAIYFAHPQFKKVRKDLKSKAYRYCSLSEAKK